MSESPEKTGPAAGRRRFKLSQEALVLAVALILVAVFSVLLDGFATVSNFFSLTRSVSALGILGLGMGLVVISRGLDLSLIAVMAVSAALTLNMLQDGHSLLVALLAGLCMAIAIGALNGFLIAFVEIPALFTTLAMGFLVYGLARTFLLASTIAYVPDEYSWLLWFGQGKLAGVPVSTLIFAVTAFATHLFLKRTTFGKFIYAQGDNDQAARMAGLSVRPMTILVYALCSAIGFLAGLVIATTTASMNTQLVNSTFVFDVILVVVLGGISLVGGRGSVVSVIAGTLLIGTLLNAMTILDFDTNAQNITKGLVLLAAILLDTWLHPRDEETARQGD